MLITFSVLQFNTDESSYYKMKVAHWHQVFLFPWSHMLQFISLCFFLCYCCMQRQLGTAQQRRPCVSCKLPGASQPEGSPLLSSFCFFVLQMEGGDKMLQRLPGSAWLSSGVQQNPFFCIRAVLLLSNYCVSQSMQCPDSTSESATAKWARPQFDVSLHQWFGDHCLKAPENEKKVHLCDATSWNVVLLAQGGSSVEELLVRRS